MENRSIDRPLCHLSTVTEGREAGRDSHPRSDTPAGSLKGSPCMPHPPSSFAFSEVSPNTLRTARKYRDPHRMSGNR